MEAKNYVTKSLAMGWQGKRRGKETTEEGEEKAKSF